MATKNQNDQTKKAPEVVEVGKANEEQLQAWKKQYEKDGPVKVIILEVSPFEKSFGYLKPASSERIIVSKAMQLHHQGLKLEVGEFILNNCWLGGDERMRSDNKMSINAATFAAQSLEFMPGEMGNA